MAVRSITLYGDPVLREKSEPIKKIDQATKDLVADLKATLEEAEGLGLAANQIGVAKRVFIVNLSGLDPAEKLRVFINPEILSNSGECEMEEGCLSFPGIYQQVTRPEFIKVRATDLEGNDFELIAEGMLARVVQHENDHIDGKLFIDYISSMARQLLSGKLKRLRSDGVANATSANGATGTAPAAL